MKIIFFGTSKFAAEILQFLVQKKLSILAVVTQPDKPKGRSQKVSESPVKEISKKYLPNSPLFQPAQASDPVFIEQMKNLRPDLFVVVGFGQILKEELLQVPRIAPINVHASLLPKYRGAAPIQRCLMAGEAKSGITLIHMTKDLDAGDILGVAEVAISQDMTAGELTEKLMQAAKPLLLRVIDKLPKGVKQDGTKATYAKKLAAEEFQIFWDFPAEQIHNRIRALSPKPGAFSYLHINQEKKRLKILKSTLSSKKGEAPGQIFPPMIVICKDGAIEIQEVQLEGKKAMSCQEFLKGVQGKIFF